jgi:hypothetical protein
MVKSFAAKLRRQALDTAPGAARPLACFHASSGLNALRHVGVDAGNTLFPLGCPSGA